MCHTAVTDICYSRYCSQESISVDVREVVDFGGHCEVIYFVMNANDNKIYKKAFSVNGPEGNRSGRNTSNGNRQAEAKMIGAMPAVAVRHERRRAEKRSGGRRPSQLQLQLGRGLEDATPSPDRYRNEIYFCGKMAVLHAIVGSLLLGIVVLVVGLVQLSPGAEAAQHRYYLMGAGIALVGAGVLAAVLRCVCLHWYTMKYREEYEEPTVRTTHKNGVSIVEHGKPGTAHEKPDKPKLKSQTSLAHEVDLIKQPSVVSDT